MAPGSGSVSGGAVRRSAAVWYLDSGPAPTSVPVRRSPGRCAGAALARPAEDWEPEFDGTTLTAGGSGFVGPMPSSPLNAIPAANTAPACSTAPAPDAVVDRAR
jgi:hypothetical protein